MASGHFARAVDLLAEAIGENADDLYVRSALAQALVALDRTREALPHLEAVTSHSPFASKERRQLAEAYYTLGMFERAAPLLESLCVSKENNTHFLTLSALVDEALGKIEEAAECWKKVARQDPDNPEAARRLYQPLAGTESPPATEITPSEAANPAPLLAEDSLRIARLHQSEGNYQEALIWYRKRLAEEPRSREGLRGVAAVHAALGHSTAALDALERFLSLEKKPGEDVLLLAGRLYVGEGRADKALPLLG